MICYPWPALWRRDGNTNHAVYNDNL
jgi:hypothetical protein